MNALFFSSQLSRAGIVESGSVTSSLSVTAADFAGESVGVTVTSIVLADESPSGIAIEPESGPPLFVSSAVAAADDNAGLLLEAAETVDV